MYNKVNMRDIKYSSNFDLLKDKLHAWIVSIVNNSEEFN